MTSINLKRLIKNSTILWLLLIAAIIILEPNYEKIDISINALRYLLAPILLITLAVIIWNCTQFIDQIKGNKFTAVQVLLSIAAVVLYAYIRINLWPTNVTQFFEFISFILIVEAIMIINEYKIADMESFEAKKQNEFDPINDLSKDLLNRVEFCNKIFTMLEEEKDDNARYALTGEWGSGKSTCLNFIAKFARDKNYPVVEFSSWQYQTKEEAWQGFVSAVDRGVAEWNHHKIGPFKTNKILFKLAKTVAMGLNNNSIGSLLNELFISKIRIDYKETKKHVSKILRKNLKGKRLVILIDDFDRTPADVLLQFFVTIRDIIDLPGCIFICAFDENATYSILNKQGIENTEDYLRKVFQQKIPIPEQVEWNAEALKPFYRSYTNIKPELINSFIELMPTNPRQLRSYLYNLDTLHYLLKESDELRWNTVYLIELARFRFPNEMRLVEQDGRLVEFSIFGPLMDKDNFNKYVEEINLKLVFKDEDQKKLFWLLIDSLRNSSFGLDKESFLRYFVILSQTRTEALSWKEYEEWLSRDNLSLLEKLSDNNIPLESRREFLKMILKERDIHLSREADVFSNNERKELLERAILLTGKAFWLVCQDELHDTQIPVFDSSVTINWINQLRKWAHFQNAYYEEIRTKELDLVKALTRKTVYHAKDCLVEIRRINLFDKNDNIFLPTLELIKDTYEKELANTLLNDLKTPGSISALWGANDHWEVKDLFMKPNPIFYSGTNLERLIRLAEEADSDYSIQENFYQMLRLLLYYGVDLGDGNALELLKKDNIREMYWQAATCKPFQRRAMGGLLETRKKLGKYILHRSDIMPIPKWFAESEPEMTGKSEIVLM